MGLFTTLIAAAAIGGGIGFGASKLAGGGGSKGGGPSAPQPLPQAPTVEAAAEKADTLKRKKVSAASKSVYTSPLGVSGEANVIKTKLGQ